MVVGRVHFILAAVLIASLPAGIFAADPEPPTMQPDQSPRPETPELPPPAPPSRIDPGIHKQPDTPPNPKSIVTPPVVDPHMAIDPEQPPRSDAPTPPPPSGNAPPPSK